MKSQTRNTILLIAGIFIFGIIGVYASTVINNNYMQQGNYIVNDSGQFYSGSKTSVRTADVVVCRGTSLLDDLYKSFTCDVVCASTDNDCSTELQGSISSNKNVFWKSGVYPIPSTSGVKMLFDTLSNVHLSAYGVILNTTMLSADSQVIFKIDSANSFYIEGLEIRGNRICGASTNCMGLEIVNSKNVYLDNINVNNILGYQVFMSSASGNSDNLNVYNSRFQGLGVADVIGGGCYGATDNVSNVNIYNNKINQTGISGNYPNAVAIVGVDNLNIHHNTAYGGLAFATETKKTINSKIESNTIYPINSTLGGYISCDRSDNYNNQIINNNVLGGFINCDGNNITIKGNTFNNNLGYASRTINLYVNNSFVEDNHVYGGQRGIIITGGVNNIISNNKIYNINDAIGIPITLDGSSYDSDVFGNRIFINTGEQVQNAIYLTAPAYRNNVYSNVVNNKGTLGTVFNVQGVSYNNTFNNNEVKGAYTNLFVYDYLYLGNYFQGEDYGAYYNNNWCSGILGNGKFVSNATAVCYCNRGTVKCY